MAIPAYMSIIGPNNELVTADASTPKSVGNLYQSGHIDEVMVQAIEHRITVPYSPQSGQVAGQRLHHPLVVTKIFDRTSPLLQGFLSSRQLLKSVEISWYRTSSEGKEERYYTTTLMDVSIVEIKDYMLHCQDPANAHLTHMQEVHFSYRQIDWTHIGSSTSNTDSWGAAPAA
ncbi:Hcp family type VI secretion system effector [Pseudomonas sp. RGM2987]|uniref:Hcp family type VI secretion system effector n=1 Tax=Pseudomonas sp. RGM2987 TaxID=2930090 RepID=UPI001FD70C3D|nr:Hcp family type VI secretion system effector [Pseudomonas sp. RGM2987]MCJ8204556.1 Hcp family type VI secretion system effector [Pseudomonas sp. RGM2987]